MKLNLYRKYRPNIFSDLIGQDEIVHSLESAIKFKKVSHAYLFSGPKGCGKTTSARILSKCLNCHTKVTNIPCDICFSCLEIKKGTSLDVHEIDAASNGGVDNARDLREQALLLPARDRYKIFIIDEAHMLTQAASNALLKIIEEPPRHVKFIFATTEPWKIKPTIRSRTFHFSFQLVSYNVLLKYLNLICKKENVKIKNEILSLVIQASEGSVRNSLSILDQLVSMYLDSDKNLNFKNIELMLGFINYNFLNNFFKAFIKKDVIMLFKLINEVEKKGYDLGNIIKHLLQYFRNLILMKISFNTANTALENMPTEYLVTLYNQSKYFEYVFLVEAVDLLNKELLNINNIVIDLRITLDVVCIKIFMLFIKSNRKLANDNTSLHLINNSNLKKIDCEYDHLNSLWISILNRLKVYHKNTYILLYKYSFPVSFIDNNLLIIFESQGLITTFKKKYHLINLINIIKKLMHNNDVKVTMESMKDKYKLYKEKYKVNIMNQLEKINE